MNLFVGVNYLAVLVAAILGMAIGAFWYSPALFGKQWMALNKFSKEGTQAAKKKGMGGKYFVSFVGLIFASCTIAHIVAYANAFSLLQGIYIGFLLAIGIAAPILIGSAIWENKPLKLFFIHLGHYLVVFILMGALLAVWQ